MKKTERQIDRLFVKSSNSLYKSFIDHAVLLYADIFPDKCTTKTFDDGHYDLIRERLQFEFGVLYNEARGEKNVKKRIKEIKKK